MERDQMKFAVFWKYVPVRTCIYLYHQQTQGLLFAIILF